jgi:hypothetical protein
MRRRLALVVFVALTILAVDPHLLRFAFVDRTVMNRVMTHYPDRGWETYPEFLEGVRAHTKPGDSIALLVPAAHWDPSYSYAYYRASYFLAGREVLPVIDRDDSVQQQNFKRAKYVAAWRWTVQPPMRAIWSGHGGALLER